MFGFGFDTTQAAQIHFWLGNGPFRIVNPGWQLELDASARPLSLGGDHVGTIKSANQLGQPLSGVSPNTNDFAYPIGDLSGHCQKRSGRHASRVTCQPALAHIAVKVPVFTLVCTQSLRFDVEGDADGADMRNGVRTFIPFCQRWTLNIALRHRYQLEQRNPPGTAMTTIVYFEVVSCCRKSKPTLLRYSRHSHLVGPLSRAALFVRIAPK